MRRPDVEYPDYGFAVHEGYITPAHVVAVVELGPSPAHRRSVRCTASAARGNVQIGSQAVAATPKPTKTKTKTKKAPEWKSLPEPEKAQYLLDHQTLSDRTWTDELRLKGEKREAFVRRILLGEVLHGESDETWAHSRAASARRVEHMDPFEQARQSLGEMSGPVPEPGAAGDTSVRVLTWRVAIPGSLVGSGPGAPWG